MVRRTVIAVALCAVCVGASPAAQSPAVPPGEPIKVNRLIERPEFRLSRNEIFANSKRAVHRHDDSQFHVLMPLTGALDLQIEGQAPIHLEPWQPHLMQGGTMHGFTNSNAVSVQFMEIFVQKAGPSANLDLADVLALALAAK